MSDPLAEIFAPRYEIQRELASKGGRRTLLARDTEREILVIIKLLMFNDSFRWQDLKLFEREAETLKSLNLAAIPQYLDYFEVDTPEIKGFALVQSYIEAPSLEQQVAAGRTFSETEVQEIAQQVLQILKYLHARQPPVIHRDIKPSNMLLGDRSGNSVGQLYLVDFGSVQNIASSDRGTLTVVGTYGYMPPEQFGGRSKPASDIYSLGATIIYLITGCHPADLPETDLKIEFESHCNISPHFAGWLQKAMNPSLSSRFESASEALAALKNLEISNNSLEQTPPKTGARITKPVKARAKLTKNNHCLEISVPPEGWSPKLIPLGFFTLFWNGFMVVWYAISISTFWQGGWMMASFGLIHLGVGVFLLYCITFALYGRTRLRIDRHKITASHQILGIAWQKPRPAASKDILKLELKKSAIYYDSDGDLQTKQPHILIWAGTTKFVLGEHSELSAPELEWLASELSQWLKLPIS